MTENKMQDLNPMDILLRETREKLVDLLGSNMSGTEQFLQGIKESIKSDNLDPSEYTVSFKRTEEGLDVCLHRKEETPNWDLLAEAAYEAVYKVRPVKVIKARTISHFTDTGIKQGNSNNGPGSGILGSGSGIF